MLPDVDVGSGAPTPPGLSVSGFSEFLINYGLVLALQKIIGETQRNECLELPISSVGAVTGSPTGAEITIFKGYSVVYLRT